MLRRKAVSPRKQWHAKRSSQMANDSRRQLCAFALHSHFVASFFFCLCECCTCGCATCNTRHRLWQRRKSRVNKSSARKDAKLPESLQNFRLVESGQELGSRGKSGVWNQESQARTSVCFRVWREAWGLSLTKSWRWQTLLGILTLIRSGSLFMRAYRTTQDSYRKISFRN